MSATINVQLIDSLAKVILALTSEEQALLSEAVQKTNPAFLQESRPAVDRFFQSLNEVNPHDQGPSLQEISQEVKAARREMHARK
ncbi:MAG: hypothetical protein AAF716_17900 [Cyanobacteria bacterium P01_D01_bin.1]